MTHPTMSNVELVQLTQAGDAVTFRVTSCAPNAREVKAMEALETRYRVQDAN